MSECCAGGACLKHMHVWYRPQPAGVAIQEQRRQPQPQQLSYRVLQWRQVPALELLLPRHQLQCRNRHRPPLQPQRQQCRSLCSQW